MRRTAQAPPRSNQHAPRIARLTPPIGARGRRMVDTDDPAAMIRELLCQAIDRHEGARRFHKLARARAAAHSGPEGSRPWENLILQAGEEVTNTESALAFLVDAVFNEVCRPEDRITDRQEIERDRTARGDDRYIKRGVELAGIAYVLRFDVGSMRAGIVARVPSGRAASV